MNLTKYPPGGFREIVRVSYPLIVGSFSLSMMVSIDRFLLACHSGLSGAYIVGSSTLGWVFIYAFTALSGICEVFVARHNGAERYHKVGESVWQMIWLSFFSIGFFYLSFLKGSEFWPRLGYLVEEPEQLYFKWTMFLGFSYPLYAALCGFFIGLGRIYMITISAVVGNVINFILDWVLIFGIDGVIPSYGIQGAAFATTIGTLIQFLFLFCFFIKKENRMRYGTNNCLLNLPVMKECVKIGLPSAIFVLFEVFAWATFYKLLFQKNMNSVLVACVCQNIWLFFYCFNEGVHKAVITITGTLFGAGRAHIIPKVIWSGVKLHMIFLGVMLSCQIFFLRSYIYQNYKHFGEISEAMYEILWFSAFCVIAHIFLDGIRLIYTGVLTAAKDTFFLMLSCSCSIWFFLVLPAYLFIIKWDTGLKTVGLLHIFYSLCLVVICWLRYLHRGWQPSETPAVLASN